MLRMKLLGGVALLAGALSVTGCGKPQKSMEEMMQTPPRPAELDQLNMLVGSWQGTAELTMPGTDEAMKSNGTSECKWELNNRALVERYEYSMGDKEKATGLAVWMWDAASKKFVNWSFYDHGAMGTTTATYDPATKTWQMKGTEQDLTTGESSYGEGTMKMIDNNTQDWQWTEWDSSWKLTKTMEMKGTAKRK